MIARGTFSCYNVSCENMHAVRFSAENVAPRSYTRIAAERGVSALMTPTAFAFFDFDATLARGDSILPYLLYCIRRGLAPRRQLLKAAAAFLRWKLQRVFSPVMRFKQED